MRGELGYDLRLCLSTWADNHSATVFSCGVSDLEMAHSIHVWFFPRSGVVFCFMTLKKPLLISFAGFAYVIFKTTAKTYVKESASF